VNALVEQSTNASCVGFILLLVERRTRSRVLAFLLAGVVLLVSSLRGVRCCEAAGGGDATRRGVAWRGVARRGAARARGYLRRVAGGSGVAGAVALVSQGAASAPARRSIEFFCAFSIARDFARASGGAGAGRRRAG